jgi:succinoglycan biosynthesis transport protein ExoP
MRPATGFLLEAASRLGLGRFFGAAEAPAELPTSEPALQPAPVTPIFRPSDDIVSSQNLSGLGQAAEWDEVDRLAAHIAGSGLSGRARRVLITHAGAEGSSLAGLDCADFGSQLARALAHEGRTILVVFGAGGGVFPGLSELIDGSASFSEAIHREAGSRLHILPSGLGRAAPGAALDVVLDALADTYDYLVLSATDEDSETLRRLSVAVAPCVDYALIGCAGQTGSPDIVALRDALKDEGAGEVLFVRLGQGAALSREAA